MKKIVYTPLFKIAHFIPVIKFILRYETYYIIWLYRQHYNFYAISRGRAVIRIDND